jgi:NADPH:quinone reductase-like Zn-dependent oxidoreductase
MNIPTHMSGVQLTGHGGPEVLVWNDAIPVPVPGPGEVLVKVAAAGVNNTDINTRVGWYAKEVTGATNDTDQDVEAGGWGGALVFPRVQGADMCGHVVAVGEGVETPIGARVTTMVNQPAPTDDSPVLYRCIGSEFDGGFAEYCLLDAQWAYDVSASPLTDVEIGAMPCAYGTALGMITRAGIKAGERVLITGASGGVGLAAVQLAHLKDAEVTAVTAAAKADTVRGAGATHVLGRGAVPPAGEFHVVIDLVGGDGWGGLIDSLRPGGCYATAGAVAGPIVEADLRTIYLMDLTIIGCTYQAPEMFAELVEIINQGLIRPVVSATYPLRDIARAQADFMSKKLPGKLVLIPHDDKAGNNG